MKQSDVFPSKYVKAEDLKGRSVKVVISHVVLEKLGNDMKPACYFQGKEKGVILNKTNFGRIAFCYGDESDNWTGKEIVLYPELVDFQGKPTWSIRVRPPEGRGEAPAATPAAKPVPATNGELNDEIPF